MNYVRNFFNAFVMRFMQHKDMRNLFVVENRYLFVATIFGIGYLKKYAQLISQLVAVLVFFLAYHISQTFYVVLLLLLIFVAFFVCEKIFNKDIYQVPYIVIDRFLGQAIAMLLSSHSLILSLISLVVFFSLSDYRPKIINNLVNNFEKGVAIIMDDILYGILTIIFMFIISIVLF